MQRYSIVQLCQSQNWYWSTVPASDNNLSRARFECCPAHQLGQARSAVSHSHLTLKLCLSRYERNQEEEQVYPLLENHEKRNQSSLLQVDSNCIQSKQEWLELHSKSTLEGMQRNQSSCISKESQFCYCSIHWWLDSPLLWQHKLHLGISRAFQDYSQRSWDSRFRTPVFLDWKCLVDRHHLRSGNSLTKLSPLLTNKLLKASQLVHFRSVSHRARYTRPNPVRRSHFDSGLVLEDHCSPI